MKALHFGAGNIGRGFIGKALADGGWQVCFVDVAAPLIEALQREKSYPVQMVSATANCWERVSGVDGILLQDESALRRELAAAQLLTTAVGVKVLPKIAPTLAAALRWRHEQGIQDVLQVVACENAVGASELLRREILQQLGTEAESALQNVYFVNCAVDRIVPPGRQENILAVTVEQFSEWVLDARAWQGERLQLEGVIYADDLMAFVERKLFTLNTGHAAAAYHGALRGAKTVQEALRMSEVAAAVRATMAESSAVLLRRHGFEAATQQAYVEKILERFANPHLRDDIQRVAREPLRKIAPDDRMVKPLRGALAYTLPHGALVDSLAAALHYRHEGDAEALQLAESIAREGLKATVRHYCQLEDEALLADIEEAYARLGAMAAN